MTAEVVLNITNYLKLRGVPEEKLDEAVEMILTFIDGVIENATNNV